MTLCFWVRTNGRGVGANRSKSSPHVYLLVMTKNIRIITALADKQRPLSARWAWAELAAKPTALKIGADKIGIRFFIINFLVTVSNLAVHESCGQNIIVYEKYSGCPNGWRVAVIAISSLICKCGFFIIMK